MGQSLPVTAPLRRPKPVAAAPPSAAASALTSLSSKPANPPVEPLRPPTWGAEAFETFARLTQKEEQRFREILVGHMDFIWRCLRRMGVPEGDCDDAAQQVFWVAAYKLTSIAPGCERAFLFGTASRIAANARRSIHRRDDAQLMLLQSESKEHENQEDLSDQLRARALMDAILCQMPEELREVFVLFELEEFSVLEVADVLTIPVGTVGSRLRRAREDFQQRVRRFKATGSPTRGTQ